MVVVAVVDMVPGAAEVVIVLEVVAADMVPEVAAVDIRLAVAAVDMVLGAAAGMVPEVGMVLEVEETRVTA